MSERLLTLREAADRFAVSYSTLKRLVADRQLATVRVGRSVRVSPVALDAYIRTHTTPATPPADKPKRTPRRQPQRTPIAGAQSATAARLVNIPRGTSTR